MTCVLSCQLSQPSLGIILDTRGLFHQFLLQLLELQTAVDLALYESCFEFLFYFRKSCGGFQLNLFLQLVKLVGQLDSSALDVCFHVFVLALIVVANESGHH